MKNRRKLVLTVVLTLLIGFGGVTAYAVSSNQLTLPFVHPAVQPRTIKTEDSREVSAQNKKIVPPPIAIYGALGSKSDKLSESDIDRENLSDQTGTGTGDSADATGTDAQQGNWNISSGSDNSGDSNSELAQMAGSIVRNNPVNPGTRTGSGTSSSQNNEVTPPSTQPVAPVIPSPSPAPAPEPTPTPAPNPVPIVPSTHHHTVSITEVTLDKADLDLIKGDSATLTATIAPTNTTQDKTITWSSSDPAVATVDSTGKVTAVEGGSAVITAKASNGKTAACDVSVSVPATKVSLSLPEAPVERGQTLKLIATLEPADTTDKVMWATSDSDIATVDDDGIVTGVAAGKATITASAGDGSVKAGCQVTTVVSISQLILSDAEHSPITDLSLIKGNEHQLTAQVLPEDTTEDKTVTWSSSDESVAKVDETGKVTAVEGGSAIITAQTGKHSAQCTVTVTVPVTGITLNKTDLMLARGTFEVLTPTIAPADATNKAVDWTSSDETVATVDNDGKVKAVSAGQAVITVKALDGGFTAHCKVTVNVPIDKISLDKPTLTLKKGEDAVLVATIEPADTTQDKTVAWTTSDSKVAAIDSTGNVTAVGGGEATITATSSNGKTATCQVTVLVPVTGVILNHSSLDIQKDTSQTLQAQISPNDATNKSVTWVSSNPAAATVDDTGRVTAVSVGNTVITATTADGEFKAGCNITVVCRVTGISISEKTITLARGNSTQLSATITPSDATDKAVSWSSSDSSVATVDSTGSVSGVAEGTATITAESHDGNFTAQCVVNVYVPVSGINLYRYSFNILKGSNYSLLESLTPDDATSKSLVWTSSNPSVATVDDTGKVTAVSTGSATVTARAVNSTAQESCTVHVVSTVHYTAVDTSYHDGSSSGSDYDKKLIGTPTGTHVRLESEGEWETEWEGDSGHTSHHKDIAQIQFNLDALVSINQLSIEDWDIWSISSDLDLTRGIYIRDSVSSKGDSCHYDNYETFDSDNIPFDSDGAVNTIEFKNNIDADEDEDDASGSAITNLYWTDMAFNNGTIVPIYDGFIS